MAAQEPPARSGDCSQDDAVAFTRDLLRLDTSNYGDGTGPGEREAAQYIAQVLASAGLEPEIIEPAPRRANVIALWRGADPARPRLLVHGHTDVVPAEAADWRFPPFSGELAEGCLWGRGAVDMKNFLGMMLAVVRSRQREKRPPARDVLLAFVADEESGGRCGAQWLCQHARERFDGCTEAIGEVGGYSVTLPTGRRLYLVETAQKGIAWYRVTATGVAGHGSMLNQQNSVIDLAEAVARIGRHRFPVRLTPTVRTFLAELAAELGEPAFIDDPVKAVSGLGPLHRIIGATLRNTATPTVLSAGSTTNVVPRRASAEIDCRYLPGFEDEFLAELGELLGPGLSLETLHHGIAIETPFRGPLVEAMRTAVTAADHDARIVPYLLPAGTDAKHFSRLGIACLGFVPLRLPAEFDFAAAFHGVDERIPVDALRFGTEVLDHFFDMC